MRKDVLEKPVFVIGAARSGTTLLTRILRAHPDVSYLAEPSFIWRRGRTHLPHEMYPTSAATPAVVARIRERFREVAMERGGRCILEKTPANSLRLGFVLAAFPDARVIHLIRDGREVAVSVRKKFEGHPEHISRRALAADAGAPHGGRAERVRVLARTFRRRLEKDPPGLDLVFWLPQLGGQVLARLGLRKRSVWGPRIPGLAALLRTHSTLEVAALQWRLSVEQVLNYQAAHPELSPLLVRFEELTRDPRATIEKVMAFAEIDPHPQVDAALAQVIASERRSHEEELRPEERARVQELIADTLLRLGYEL